MATVRNFLFSILCFFTGHDYRRYSYNAHYQCSRCKHTSELIGKGDLTLLDRIFPRSKRRKVSKAMRTFWRGIEDYILSFLMVALVIGVIILLIFVVDASTDMYAVRACEKSGIFMQVAWAYDSSLGCLLQAYDGKFIQDEYYNYTGGN